MEYKRGKIFVLTGPSGVGKTEIAKNILKNKELNIQKVTTCTTRSIRPGEKDGRDYFFLSKEKFLNNIKNKKMFEYAEVYGNYYGSRKEDVEKILNYGKNILFTVDVKGAFSLKKIVPSCKTFFIKAESISELKKRLLGRNTDSRSIIEARIKKAIHELNNAKKFDYIIVNYNGKMNKTIEEVSNLIRMLSKRVILIEGLPGTGKSSVLQELGKTYLVVYEFHTKRKKITNQFGAYRSEKRIGIGNKKVESLEDKLENIILNSRFINEDKKNLKLSLLKEKLKECFNLNGNLILKEGFLGCLIDKNKKEFLDELRKLLLNVDCIIFLKLSEKQLYDRQIARLKNRNSEYDDKTNKQRHKLFINQFRYLTRGLNVFYIDASPSPDKIVKKIKQTLSLC